MYAQARYYNAENKVWLSQDPYFWTQWGSYEFLLDPQAQNPYSYVKNNPMRYTDPDGKWWKEYFLDNPNPFVKGQSTADLRKEIDQSANTMYQTSPTWKWTMDNPKTASLVIAAGTIPALYAGESSLVAFKVAGMTAVRSVAIRRATEGLLYSIVTTESLSLPKEMVKSAQDYSQSNSKLEKIKIATKTTANMATSFSGEKIGAIADTYSILNTFINTSQNIYNYLQNKYIQTPNKLKK